MDIAASKAEQAFRQQPNQGAWALLWVTALEAQQQPEQADAAIGTALQLGAPNVEALRTRRVALGRQRALLQAQQAYQSLSAGEDAAAIEQARAAVELAPDAASYRLLLIDQNPQKQYANAFTGAPLPFSRAAFSTKRSCVSTSGMARTSIIRAMPESDSIQAPARLPANPLTNCANGVAAFSM